MEARGSSATVLSCNITLGVSDTKPPMLVDSGTKLLADSGTNNSETKTLIDSGTNTSKPVKLGSTVAVAGAVANRDGVSVATEESTGEEVGRVVPSWSDVVTSRVGDGEIIGLIPCAVDGARGREEDITKRESDNEDAEAELTIMGVSAGVGEGARSVVEVDGIRINSGCDVGLRRD